MKSQVLSNWDIPWLPSLALLLFLAVFITMLFMIFRKDAKGHFNKISEIPLNEGRNQNEQ